MSALQHAVPPAKSGTGRTSDSYVVRMPDGMRDLLKARSKQKRRSMNSEIVALIEAGLTSDGVSVEPIVWRQPQESPPAAASELLIAELIIVIMLGLLTTEQKSVAQAQLDAAGIVGADFIRSQERRAAIVAGGAA